MLTGVGDEKGSLYSGEDTLLIADQDAERRGCAPALPLEG